MSRERITFLVAVLITGLLVWTALAGRSAPSKWVPSKGDRANYEPRNPQSATFVDDNLARYLESGNTSPFMVLSDKRDLPPQDIDLPPAALGMPALPEFDPAPDADVAQSALAASLGIGAARVPREPAGRPVPAAAEMPPMSDLEAVREAALRALADTPREDDAPVEPVYDSVMLKTGSRKEGTILNETPEDITLRLKNGGVVKFERKDILNVTPAQGPTAEIRERSRKLAAGDAKGRFELAQLCLERKMLEEAAQELQLTLEADPKFLRAYVELARLHRNRSDLDGELLLLQRGLKAGVLDSEVLHLRVAEIYDRIGLPAEALESLAAAVSTQPSFAPARIALGLACAHAGRYDEAMEHLDKARSMSGQDPTLQLALAEVSYRRLDLDAALAAADQALVRDAALAPAHNLRGVILAAQGKFADAAKSFLATIKASPFLSAAWINLGILYVLADKLDEAAFVFDLARKLDPTAATAIAVQGLLAHLKGDVAAARPLYESALQVDPSNYYAHYALGHASLEQNEVATAVQELTLSLKKNPAFAGSLYSGGVAFLRDRQFDRAIRLLKRNVAIEPGRARAQAALGLAYLGANQADRADGALREALRLEPDHAPALAGLAYASFFGGRGQDALTKFQRVLELLPDDPYTVRALSLVRESATRTQWEDTFDRSDREDVGHRWFEAERCGVQVGIKDKALLFTGNQAVTDNGVTSLHRVVLADTFLRIEAELDIAEIGRANAGLFVEARSATGEGSKSGVYFARNEKNKMQYAFATEGATSEGLRWIELSGEAEGKTIRLGIERTRDESGGRAWQFLVNGKILDTKKSPPFNIGENFTVGIFGQAMRGEKWSLRASRARVIEEKKKQ